MDSKYIITSSGTFIDVDELYHHGIKGMKWGVRRYQNPDGSLTDRGKKRYTNPDGSLNEKGKKKFGDSVTTIKNNGSGSKGSSGENSDNHKRVSEMSDSDLQSRVNRLRNEDAYRDLSKKLGYDGPKTELDAKIESMEKQKRYLELQRDINNLTPKKENKAKKLIEKLYSKVIEPVAIEAGKKYLNNKLGDLGSKAADKTKDTLGKEAKDAAKTVNDSYERVKNKQSKKEAKRAARRDNGKVFTGKVEGVGTSSKKTNTGRTKPKTNTVFDMEPHGYLNEPIRSSTTERNASNGRSYVSDYLDTPVNRLPSPNIAGYLPAPKDDK